MKKFLTSFAVATIFSMAANTQDAPQPAVATAPAPTATIQKPMPRTMGNRQQMNQEMPADKMHKKAERIEKYQNASPEEKAKMDNRRAERMQQNQGEMKENRQGKMDDAMMDRKERWQEKHDNASPQDQARMEKRHEVMQNLSAEQKIAVKQEVARHREAMKKFGFGDDGMNADSAQ